MSASVWSPEFRESLHTITSHAISGEYDKGWRQRASYRSTSTATYRFRVCDEGGRTRDVINGDKTYRALTYIALVEIYKQNDTANPTEYWLLDDGRVFEWKSDQTDFVDPHVVLDELISLAQD